ncbi:protein RETARDED ROOT GROWTH-LIKE-like isoform X2 [Actinidia eriantha]|uniref:protein RETARDED ROOT GROWTH-LIKE-like isoform X2 n=1 Tax=Actinidia eriantha TaxID=165200 RepID=UPI002589FF92|nr:protein RETARDED ROOT GROWTH-LIKE-like isoform X2 [Actinidia eriantha]
MKMFRHRSINTHMKSILLLPSSLSPPRTTIKAFTTLFALSNHSSRLLPTPSPPHTRSSSLYPPQNLSLRRTSNSSNFSRNSSRSFGFNFVEAKCVSSISSAHTLEWNEPVPCSESGDCSIGGVSEEESKPSISVRAYFFSTSVNLRSLVEQNKPNIIPPTSRMTNYVVLRFGNAKAEPNGLGANLTGSDCCYMVVFQYGSIVLFNVRDHEVDDYLKIVRRHASGLLPETRKDEYEVREKLTLDTWMQGGLDYIMLQYLNIDGIRIIGSVLGQSIALDYYVRQVDGMVAEFTDINRGMEKTGTFTMERKKLFQLVGKANSNLADVILKLGLFERSDIAWKDAKYAQIWEYLRDEFELTQRFASLDFKLKFVEHNIRFLQEILQNRKSDFLEWLIIILIGAEILISVYGIVHQSAITSL